MSIPLILAFLWVLAAAVTAMLPMRRQYPPGLTLLIIAPFLIVWLAIEHNVWIVLLATAGFVSMFRNPLIYIARRALGLPVSRPETPKVDP
jgi:hypothetical protein